MNATADWKASLNFYKNKPSITLVPVWICYRFRQVIAVGGMAAAGELQLDYVKSHLLVKVVTPLGRFSYCY